MKKKGKKLHFVSIIKRDGSGTNPVPSGKIPSLDEDKLKLFSLSLSHKTYIATDFFNYYIVKIIKEIERHYEEITELYDVEGESFLEYYRDQ